MMRRFQSHTAIAESLELKVLKPDMFTLSTAAKFLAAIFEETAGFAKEHTPSPYLTCPHNHHYAWLEDLPTPERYSPDNSLTDSYRASRNDTSYRLDFFADRSALLSFTKEDEDVRKYVPWALQFEHFFTTPLHKFDIAVNPYNRRGCRLHLVAPEHLPAKLQDLEKANNDFTSVLLEDIVAVADAFQDAIPLLRDFSQPDWLKQKHLAIAPFATFSNPTGDHREEIWQLLRKLIRYISATNPGIDFVEATCFAAYIDEENRLQPSYIELSCGGDKSGDPFKFTAWFKQYMNHPKCVVPRHLQFIQDLGGPEEITWERLSHKLVPSAHERLEAYADMKPYFDVLPAPEGHGKSLS